MGPLLGVMKSWGWTKVGIITEGRKMQGPLDVQMLAGFMTQLMALATSVPFIFQQFDLGVEREGYGHDIILTSPAPHMLTTDSETLRARSESSDSHRTRGRLTAVTMIPALQDTEQHF